MDIVDTNGRAEDKGPAKDYLRYFADHFTDDEWETIKRSGTKQGGCAVGGFGRGGWWADAENGRLMAESTGMYYVPALAVPARAM